MRALILALATTLAAQEPPIQPSPKDTATLAPIDTQLAPGVRHRRFTESGGPWTVNVLAVDLRQCGCTFAVERAAGQYRGLERTTALSARVTARGTTVLGAVNADFFDLRGETGVTENSSIGNGFVWRALRGSDSPFGTSQAPRTQFAIDEAGRPRMDRFALEGELGIDGIFYPVGAVNGSAPWGTAAIYTSAFGTSIAENDTAGATVVPLERWQRGALGEYTARIATVAGSAAQTPIPADGAVIVVRGALAHTFATLRRGRTVTVSLRFVPGDVRLRELTGGWLRLIKNGVAVGATSDSVEGTPPAFSAARHPRTGVGFSRDSSTILLVTVDGRRKSSVGMSLAEFAALFERLGASEAMNLDGGGSTAMVVGGTLVNLPSDATERAVGNALLVVKRR
ncbi:MAG: phosphodiester glycosidase family protein [Gemmatimonadaceae bacterium]|nr:phosphodiester glycosidase family protein [Gemmatimonadaceae bacterium]